MTIRLSCADYTWLPLPHTLALDVIAGLGFDGVDLGFFSQHSHLNEQNVRKDAVGWAGRIRERCETRGLAVADLFFQAPGPEALAVNHPNKDERGRSREVFSEVATFAASIGSPGLTILPGIVFGEEEWRDAFERSAVELRERVALAEDAGLTLSVEPHVGSIVDLTTRAAELVEAVPGLSLTLDYSHFLVAGDERDEIDGLLEHTRHVHCRASSHHRLQTALQDDVVDYPRMVRLLRQSGYSGYLACEYVWSEWMHLNEVNTMAETVALAGVLRDALA